MLKGWASGMASVDPSLNAGVYASQSEYRNYTSVTQSMPVFVAIAFGNGGPTPIARDRFEYSRLHIFRRRLHPASTCPRRVHPPEPALVGSVQHVAVQHAGVYCAPTTP